MVQVANQLLQIQDSLGEGWQGMVSVCMARAVLTILQENLPQTSESLYLLHKEQAGG